MCSLIPVYKNTLFSKVLQPINETESYLKITHIHFEFMIRI